MPTRAELVAPQFSLAMKVLPPLLFLNRLPKQHDRIKQNKAGIKLPEEKTEAELAKFLYILDDLEQDIQRCQVMIKNIAETIKITRESYKSISAVGAIPEVGRAEALPPPQEEATVNELETAQATDFIFDFDERIRNVGWYKVEQHWAGKPYRWSGPEIESVVVLDVPRSSAYRVTTEIVGVMDPVALDAIKVFADGRPLRSSVLLARDGEWQLLFEVPAREGAGRNEVEIAFRVLATLKPSVVKNEPDDRLLGIAVSRFRFEPVEQQ